MGCGGSWAGFDRWAGLEADHLAPWVRRAATLAASSWSFDMASARLWELCGVRISDQSIRRASQEVGRCAQAWLSDSDSATQGLKKAKGETEAYVDGTMVNTREGWREMKLVAVAKRPRGKPATINQWSKRVVPDPTARLVTAGICDAQWVGQTLKKWSQGLGLGAGREVSVLADGAKWIWGQMAEVLPEFEGNLDVYHLMEHLHACGKGLYGETDRARSWAGQECRKLMEKGSKCYLKRLRRQVQEGRLKGPAESARVAALCELLKYLWPNRHRLDYKGRLQRGLVIGSGMIEGACKTVAGRRLKLNSARWNPEGADAIAALCSLQYSNLWNDFWLHSHPAS